MFWAYGAFIKYAFAFAVFFLLKTQIFFTSLFSSFLPPFSFSFCPTLSYLSLPFPYFSF